MEARRTPASLAVLVVACAGAAACFPSLGSLTDGEHDASLVHDARRDTADLKDTAGDVAIRDAARDTTTPRDGGVDALADAKTTSSTDAAPTELTAVGPPLVTPIRTDGIALYFATSQTVYSFVLDGGTLNSETDHGGVYLVTGNGDGGVFFETETTVERLALGANQTGSVLARGDAGGFLPGLALHDGRFYVAQGSELASAPSAVAGAGVTISSGFSGYYWVEAAGGDLVFLSFSGNGEIYRIPLDAGSGPAVAGVGDPSTNNAIASNGQGVVWWVDASVDYTDGVNLGWQAQQAFVASEPLTAKGPVALDDRNVYAVESKSPCDAGSTGQIVERAIPLGDAGAVRVLATGLRCPAGIAATGGRVYFTAVDDGAVKLYSVPR